MEKKSKKRPRAAFEPLPCIHSSKQQSTNGCHYVPFGRISQTVTRRADPAGSEVSDKPLERDQTEEVINKRWSDKPWNVRVMRDTFGSQSLNTLEKDVPGIIDNGHEKTIDLLLHPSRLRRKTKRGQRDASSQNMNDVTRHIQQLKSKQSLCDPLMEKIHREKAHVSCEGIKYRLQVLKPSTNVRDKEEKPICPGLDQLTSESASFLDKLASTTKGPLQSEMETVGQSALDSNVLTEPFGLDCKPICGLLDKAQSRPLDSWNSEQTDGTDLPDSRIALPDGVLDNFKDHTAEEGFSYYGNDTSFRHNLKVPDINSSFFTEPGISWTSPIMSSTPKERWLVDSPQEAYKANYLDMASLWSDNTNTVTEYSGGPVAFLDQQQLWTTDFGFQNPTRKKPSSWMPLANLTDPDQCSLECNSTCCRSPVKASEHLSTSVDDDAIFQKSPFNTASYAGEDDTLLHPVEKDLPSYWLKHSSNIFEE